MAAGLAIAGKKPVAVAFSMFLMRGWEQIRNSIARDSLNVKLVGTHSGLSDHMDGSSHQCFEDIALMRALPGFTVLSPSDPRAAEELILRAIEHRGPVYVRLGRDNAPLIYGEGESFRIGGSRVIEDSGDAVIFSHGPMVGVALEASKILKSRGVRVGVVDVYSLKPADTETIVKQSSRASLVVSLEDHSVVGGLGSLIAETLSELGSGAPRLLRIGLEGFGTSSRDYWALLDYMGLSPLKVARRIEGALA
jgi:transketolase